MTARTPPPQGELSSPAEETPVSRRSRLPGARPSSGALPPAEDVTPPATATGGARGHRCLPRAAGPTYSEPQADRCGGGSRLPHGDGAGGPRRARQPRGAGGGEAVPATSPAEGRQQGCLPAARAALRGPAAARARLPGARQSRLRLTRPVPPSRRGGRTPQRRRR